jgi:hypothetical protein
VNVWSKTAELTRMIYSHVTIPQVAYGPIVQYPYNALLQATRSYVEKQHEL